MYKTQFLKKLHLLNGKEYLEAFILYSSAPVLTKIKPAVMIKLTIQEKFIINEWYEIKEYVNKYMKLSIKLLRKTDTKITILIFDEKLMYHVLCNYQSMGILSRLGYDLNASVEGLLYQLRDRFLEHSCPHEVGIFLGYPPEDVESFMNNNGKNSVFCGIWKVYNNVAYAKEIFKEYNIIKEQTALLLIKGTEYPMIINTIRDFKVYSHFH